MRPGWVVMIAILAMVAMLAGCGGGSNELGNAFNPGNTPSDGGDDTPIDITQPCDGVLADATNLHIVNNTSVDFGELYFTPSTHSSWGENLLDGTTIPSGDEAWFCDIQPCDVMYDGRIGSGGFTGFEEYSWLLAECGEEYTRSFHDALNE